MNPKEIPMRRTLSTTTVGVALAAVTAAISGVSVWVNAYGVSQVPDAILYTTLKNGAAVAILVLALGALAWHRSAPAATQVDSSATRRPDARTALALLFVGIFGGGVAFVLFFSGLAQATASGAAFIQKTLFIWVAILAVPFLGERLGLAQVGALGALLAGQALLAPPKAFGWGTGETMIVAATLIWAAEVVVARRLLRGISPLRLGVTRLGIGLIVLVGAVALVGHAGSLGAISAGGWALVAITGALLAAYVATWFSALQRAPASLVTAILVGGALVTAALQAIAAGRGPEPAAVGGALLMVAGIAVVLVAARRDRSRAHTATAA
jgi:drug/metabolite transporter (DMT)-like permease